MGCLTVVLPETKGEVWCLVEEDNLVVRQADKWLVGKKDAVA